MGPTFGTVFRAGEDTLNAITKSNKFGKHNFTPIGRDLLEDTVPIAGNILAHKLLPTNKEAGTTSSRRGKRRH